MRRPLVPDELSHGPFTVAAAARAGVSRHALRGRAWRRLWRDVWVVASLELTRATWLAAARLVLPVDAVLCGLSALDAYGVDVRHQDDVTVHVAVAEGVPRPRPNLSPRQLALTTDEVVAWGGWLVTTPVRTAFDCARWLPLTEAVVALDALAHAGLFAVEELLAFATAHPGVRAVRRVAAVAALLEPRSESPMESRLRVLLIRAGLPRPTAQLNVLDATGRFVARLDLAYEAAKLAVEYDGSHHWRQRREDDRRRDAIRALGWTVLVFSADDVYQSPAAVVAQVAMTLRSCAA